MFTAIIIAVYCINPYKPGVLFMGHRQTELYKPPDVTPQNGARVRARKYFSFATTFANLIFFVPFSKSLSQDFGHILPETFIF